MSEKTKQKMPLKTKLFIVLLLIIVGLFIGEFASTTRMTDVTNKEMTDARGGSISITYSRPVDGPLYSPADPGVKTTVALTDDHRTETHTLIYPTPYNKAILLKKTGAVKRSSLLSFLNPPVTIEFTTGIEQVSIKGLTPSEKTTPAPDTMNNQLVLMFNGEIRGKFKKGVNISAAEMDYVKLTPEIEGYYRWTNDTILTFNFTGKKPQFETKYEFTVFPETFINKDYQNWAGEDVKTIAVTTSTNEVYVSDFSLNEKVTWREPLYIEFSGNMVGALDVLKKKSKAMVPVTITPDAGGYFIWTSARVLKFVPDNKKGWPVRNTVNVSVQPEINKEIDRKWRNGNKPEQFSFYVLPREQSIKSYNLTGNSINLDEDLVVTFSRKMVDKPTIGKTFSNKIVSDNIPFIITPSLEGTFLWVRQNRVKFKPSNLWSELKEYTITLNSDFNPDKRYDWVGTKNFAFKTVENVVDAEFYFTPENRISPSVFFTDKGKYSKTKEILTESRLLILFDKDIGRFIKKDETLANHIIITPAVNGKFEWLSNSLLEFTPDTNWSEKTDYSIKLTSGLLSHPEQHFNTKKNTFKFKTSENIVKIAELSKSSIDQKTPGRFRPDKSLEFNFSKNIHTLIKIGKKYKSTTLTEQNAPIIIKPATPFTFYWNDQRKLILSPETYWQPSTDYTVSLNPNLLPQKEAGFQYGKKYHLKTEKNYVRISSFTPQGKVDRRIVVDALFSKSIRPKALKNGDIDKTGLFSVSPEIEGAWIWLSDSKIQLKPENPLSTSTAYSISFDPEKIEDQQFTWHIPKTEGETKLSKEVYHFNTAPLHVKKSFARFEFNKKDLLKQKFYLDIELSDYVKEDTLRKHFSLWYKKKTKENEMIEVPLLYTLEKNETKNSSQGKAGCLKTFSVVSDWVDRPSKDRRVDYKIVSDLPAHFGNLVLNDDYSGYFYQEKAKHLKLNRIRWEMKDRNYFAKLDLNAPVDPELLRKNLIVGSIHSDTGKLKPLEYEISVASSNSDSRFIYEIKADFTPGVENKFILNEGVLAADGAFTPDTIEKKAYTPDLSTKLDFALNGNFISIKDLNKIPVVTTNRDYFNLRIEKIFANNVNYFLNNNQRNSGLYRVAKTIYDKRHKVTSKENGTAIHNKTIITHIDLSHIVKENPHGLFRISLNGSRSRRFFISTDIGLIARQFNNKILIWANSLHSLTGINALTVEAVDKWNQVTGKSVTNQNGYAEITFNKDTPPKFIIAKKGNDFSFIDLEKHREKLTGADIEGIKASNIALRTYLYSDRGVYRPGDTVHLVSVTRGKEGDSPENLPVKFTLTNPVGKKAITERYTLDDQGLFVYDYSVPSEAKTGKWQASVYRGGYLMGSYTFQVEEFIPNKIKVDLKKLNKKVYSGDTLRFEVNARNLFGPPASGRPVSGSIYLRANNFKPQGHGAYSFGNGDIQFQRMDEDLAEVKLDDNGTHVFDYKIPDTLSSPSGLTINYSAVVIDDSGRGVAAYGSSDVHLYSQYVGIKKISKALPEINKPVGFHIVNIDSSGKSIEKNQQDLNFKIYRNKKITHYRKNERGYYRYVTEKERILVAEFDNPIAGIKDGKYFYTPLSSGDYILAVEDKIGKQITHHWFHVTGNDSTSVFTEASDKVELKVLNKKPAVNDTLTIEVVAPFNGKVLLTGEQDTVLFSKVVSFNDKKAIVSLPLTKKHLPNFYLSAIAIKSVQEGSEKDPIYATGLLNVTVHDKSHSPAIKLSVPKRAAPNGEMTVSIKVADTNNAEMYFTIAAVDQGIIDLTGFKLPDMKNYFNMKRRLEVGHYSMYPMVMPLNPDVKNLISPSGDMPSRGLIKKKRVNPASQKRVKSVALWSGLLKTDKDGNGACTFKIPDFNGSLKVMAVAFGRQRFASSQGDVIIRDNLVMKPSLPRFAATGDSFIIPVTLFNLTTVEGEVTTGLKVSDHLTLNGPSERSVFLAPNQEATIGFSVDVNNEIGLSEFTLISEGLGEKTLKTIMVPVRTPGTLISKYDSGVVDKNTPRSIPMPDIFINGTRELSMKVTSNPLARFQNSLKYLLRYPHGCLEQTTSKLFPLLYYSDLAMSAGEMFTSEKRPRYYLNEGIKKIERMQLENGAFSYWEGGNYVNQRAFVYASHFIVEAKAAGLEIDENIWNNMIYQLNKKVSVTYDDINIYSGNTNISNTVYGLYVLSRAGENVFSKLNYIYEGYFDSLKTHDKARLASAFAAAGEKETAISILSDLKGFDSYNTLYRETGGDFNSNARDLAIILDSFVEIQPDLKQIQGITNNLMALANNGRWGSTQENAYSFLAIGKAMNRSKSLKTKAEITLGDGEKLNVANEVLLETPELLKGEVRIEVKGEGSVNYVWEAVGIDKAPSSLQVDKGLKIRRTFLDKNGEKADLSKIKQGTLLVAEIKIQSLEGRIKNVAITDLLPSGLEIENPRLSTSTSLTWINQNIVPDYLDIRDDRINLFFTVPEEEKTYYYTTRAVTAGNFKVPAIHAEAMYNPDIYSEADSGTLNIAPMGH